MGLQYSQSGEAWQLVKTIKAFNVNKVSIKVTKGY